MAPLHLPPQATHDQTKEWASFRQVGSTLDRYYAASHTTASTLTTFTGGVNTMYAVPFWSGSRGGTIDRLAFAVTTGGGAGSVAKAAIYSNDSDTNLIPASLLVQGDEFDTTATGMMETTIDLTLEPNKLYWFVLWAGVAAPTVRGIPVAGQMPVMGLSNALATSVGIGRNRVVAYGANFPSSWGSSGNVSAGVTMPCIAVRYSA